MSELNVSQPTQPHPSIFLCYRRGSGWASQINRSLVAAFGQDAVFFDQRSIRIGDHLPDTIKAAIARSSVVLVEIGPGWSTSLGDPSDWVRQEIEHAIGFGKRIMPVLVGDASPLEGSALPKTLAPLADHLARSLSEKHFERDVQDLVDELVALGFRHVPPQRKGRRLLRIPQPIRLPLRRGLVVVASAVVLGVAIVLLSLAARARLPHLDDRSKEKLCRLAADPLAIEVPKWVLAVAEASAPFDTAGIDQDDLRFFAGASALDLDSDFSCEGLLDAASAPWLEVYCLRRRLDTGKQFLKDGPSWLSVSQRFSDAARTTPSAPQARQLVECSTFARAQSLWRFAEITGRTDGFDEMIATANSLVRSDEDDMAGFLGSSLVDYGLPAPCDHREPGCWISRADAVAADLALDRLTRDAGGSAWTRLSADSHRRLAIAAKAIEVNKRGGVREESEEQEAQFAGALADLQEFLVGGDRPAAAAFLGREESGIRKNWFQKTRDNARTACRVDPRGDAGRDAAQRLDHLRSIHGWWIGTPISQGDWQYFTSAKHSWLLRWQPVDEVITALCGAASGHLAPAEAEQRLVALFEQRPEDRELCSIDRAGSMWQAALERLPSLTLIDRRWCESGNEGS